MADFWTSIKSTTGRALAKVFGTAHERTMKRLRPLVQQINDLESSFRRSSDAELRATTGKLKEKLDQGASLDDVLPDAFAAVREASLRTTGMRHYDVQLVGGIVLHQGMIAEMKTGEGKTLVATLPLYLNALAGKGCHLVTVNDYLAKRDAEWMGQIYGFLGLSTGVIEHGQSRADKMKAYGSDITYGQNNEFGFDYLRDNMRFSIHEYVQRDLFYAIVDEADSILIDEARTPLIISGAAEESAGLYVSVNQVIPKLRRDIHFNVDEERRTVTMTEEGVDRMEELLSIGNLYDPANIEYIHHVHQALKAHYCYKKDVNYAVKDGEIVIIDEFTGRLMPGRRWSDGLHQAVEAKENVKVQEENRTLATISFQNLFRLYDKLAGMTGTADTEAMEFSKTYKLDVVVIPTNRPCVRTDFEDVIYRSYREKRTALIEEITDCQERGQPVLVGTVSVEKSEDLARVLTRKGIHHHVLNAKHHEREAYIVAQAGRAGAVTVATNMAGRGTDILLGGNPTMLARAEAENFKDEPEEYERVYRDALIKFESKCAEERVKVIEAGGLHILGTERHESRRIDNQLRGRSGRQGDPGTSRFYLSLEDDLMRIFAGERVGMIMDRLGMPEGEPIEHRMVTRSVERAQTKVEARNFDIRKNLLEYDDVMNQQRKTIYALRRQILEGRYQTVAISDDEEIKRQVAQSARHVNVDPVIERRVAASLRRWFLRFGKPRRSEQGHDRDDPRPVIESLASINGAELEQNIYDQYGVRVTLKHLVDEPAEAYEVARRESAQALSEQRERLFDMIDASIAALIVEHAAPRNLAERDLDGLVDAARKTFDIWVEDLGRFGSADEIAQHLYEEVEWVVRQRDSELSRAETDEIIDLLVHEHCPLAQEPSLWKLDRLRSQLTEKLGIEMIDLEPVIEEARNAVERDAPREGDGQDDLRAAAMIRRSLAIAIREHQEDLLLKRHIYVLPRDERAREAHPAEKVVRELTMKHCPAELESAKWDLEALAGAIEETTGAAPARFSMDVLLGDAQRDIEHRVVRAAEDREREILEKIVSRFCATRDTEKWDREGLANEIMEHMGMHCSSIEIAESRNDLIEGIFRDVRDQHHRQVIEPLLEKVAERCPMDAAFESWDLAGVAEDLAEHKIVIKDLQRLDLRSFVIQRLFKSIERVIRARAHVLSPEAHLHALRQLQLSEIDKQWIDHLQNMEALRQGIGLTSYGQRDPKREYQREGYGMFQAMVADIQSNVIEKLFHVVFHSEADAARLVRRRSRATVEGRGDDRTVQKGTVRRQTPKVGRNDPCPCGSGKKYKKCCMLKDQPSA
jgi:preprotein translocase subunit SecA